MTLDSENHGRRLNWLKFWEGFGWGGIIGWLCAAAMYLIWRAIR